MASFTTKPMDRYGRKDERSASAYKPVISLSCAKPVKQISPCKISFALRSNSGPGNHRRPQNETNQSECPLRVCHRLPKIKIFFGGDLAAAMKRRNLSGRPVSGGTARRGRARSPPERQTMRCQPRWQRTRRVPPSRRRDRRNREPISPARQNDRNVKGKSDFNCAVHAISMVSILTVALGP